jgi:Tol biopolymer transport system component
MIATRDLFGGPLVALNLPGANLPKILDVREPALSPDLATALFWKSTDSDAPIYRADFSTGKVSTFAEGNCRSPGFDPSGSTIFYTKFDGKDWRLLLKPKAQATIKVRSIADGVFMPVWSNGNDALVVHDMTNVYRIDAGGNRRGAIPVSTFLTSSDRITSATVFTDRPGDPSVVAFDQDARGDTRIIDKMTGMTGAIFVYDLASKTRRRLTGEDFSARLPRWSPDGQYIYFSGRRLISPRGTASGIYRVRSRGGVPEKMSDALGEFSIQTAAQK